MKFIKKKEDLSQWEEMGMTKERYERALSIINGGLILGEAENFSISAKMIRDNPTFHNHLKKPFSKLLGAIVCKEKGIKLVNEYSVYSHWLSLFFRNFASITNSIENEGNDKKDLIYKAIRNITNYIKNKNNLETIWDIFTREELKRHQIKYGLSTSQMKTTKIEDDEWEVIAHKFMSLIVPMIDFNPEQLLNNISDVFGKEIFDSRFNKGEDFVSVLKGGIKHWY